MNHQFPDKPKNLGNPTVKAARLAQLGAPHIAPLAAYVQNLRAEIGEEGEVPDFDPWDGGVEAKCLFLLEAPGPKAIASGFVSRNNPDETANNFFELNTQADIDRKLTVAWNIVPWYIGSGTKIRPANTSDITEGAVHLARLLPHLPHLSAVVLVGGKAGRMAEYFARSHAHLRLFTCPHFSPLFVNMSPGNREIILKKLQEVARFLSHGQVAFSSSPLPEAAPIESIFSTILFYALIDGARALRLEPSDKGTALHYLVGEQWQEQMKIPNYVHKPLLTAIRHGVHNVNLVGIGTLFAELRSQHLLQKRPCLTGNLMQTATEARARQRMLPSATFDQILAA